MRRAPISRHLGRKQQRARQVVRPFEQLEVRCVMAADVYISEFLASNNNGIPDEDGDRSDWIELYNDGPDSVDLNGWYLSDDATNLNKWAFPALSFQPGTTMLVFASGKDRVDGSRALHTNFRLSAGGEFLALSRQEAANGSPQIVSAYTPEFPEQLEDISYGVGQTVQQTVLVQSDQAAQVLFPTGNQLGNSWIEPGFDDSAWSTKTASIGYRRTVDGFRVFQTQATGTIVNLTEAVDLLTGSGVASEAAEIAPYANYLEADADVGTNLFVNDRAFPGNTSTVDTDFAVSLTGDVTIPVAGDWTFLVNADDGFRMTIDGRVVLEDDTLHENSTQRLVTLNLTRGSHAIELLYFQRAGSAGLEFAAASGVHEQFTDQFRLVGDTTNGGLRIRSSPDRESDFSPLIVSSVPFDMSGISSSAYMRMPFQVPDPNSLESLTLRVNYDDGFVAYLNGVQIASGNAPAELTYDSVATIDRPNSEALFRQDIDVTAFLGLLNSGENVLAVHGLNDSIVSPEFVLSVELADIEVTRGDVGYFAAPTPRDFNATEVVEGFLLNEIQLSHPRGFYQEPFMLEMSAVTVGVNIRYTTDGTNPTATNGIDYAGPILIDATTNVRARAFRADRDPSLIETATYIFLSDVVTQSPTGQAPAGFPTGRSINGQTLDYGMDPSIVNSATWGPQLQEALLQVPSLSVTMDINDLLGTSRGIYTHADSHGRAWERPASLELIQPDGSDGFQIDAGIRIRGGFSRSNSNPKHAFRFFFRSEYGDSKLQFPLFGGEGVEEFDSIDLRTTQNYSWAFQGDGTNAFVRDVFARDVQRETGQPYTRSRYYHLYINGQYWGLYQTQERAEASFAASYFGGQPEDYDVVKSAGSTGGYTNEVTDGNFDAYRRLSQFFYQSGGLSNSNMEDYWRVQGMNSDGSLNPAYERLLDVDNLIDYMLVTYYTGDRDAPVTRFIPERVNNYFAIYNRKTPDGFKFFEHDSEHSLDKGEANLVALRTTSGRQFQYFNPMWMHEQLASTNSEYRLKFADHIYKNFYNDGPLADANARALIESRAAEFDMAIIAESARWGDAKREPAFTKTNWESAVRTVISRTNRRADTVLRQFQSQNWLPDSEPPLLLVNGNSQHGGEISSSDLLGFGVTTLDFNAVLVESGAAWSFLDDGTDQGIAWREPDFDDSAWQTGRAEFGFGETDQATTVRNETPAGDRIPTHYFRLSFDLADPENYDALLAEILRDDGAVVYLNGVEVGRSNMPEGEIEYGTFANSSIGGVSETTFFDLAADAGLLQAGRNVLAVEVHQRSLTNTDMSFDLRLLGNSRSGDGGTYYTLDGSDPRMPDASISPLAMRYTNDFRLAENATVSVRSLGRGQWSPIQVASYAVKGGLAGDLNGDGQVNAVDIDQLVAAMNGGDPAGADLDGNGLVNESDLTVLVEDILGTRRGDADLDGDVDFQDFVRLAQAFGSSPASWSEGNFDADNTVGFSDFVQLATNFGFQVAAGLPVPVPSASANPSLLDAAAAVDSVDSTEESTDDAGLEVDGADPDKLS